MRFLGVIRQHPVAPDDAERWAGGKAYTEKLGYLATTDIFQGLIAHELAELDRMTAMTTCRRGRVFYTPDETGEVLFILKQGKVNVYRLTPDGHKLTTATIGPGTIFGEMSLIGEGMQGSFAEAGEDCTLCLLSRADLEHLVTTMPSVALRLIEVLGARLQAAQQQLEAVTFHGVPARIAATLVHLTEREGRDVANVTHQDLAEMLGVHRETVTRILNDLQARGLIELHRGYVRVLAPQDLRSASER